MRVNNRIRVSPVRLIGPDGEQVGILPTAEALQRATDLGLDLVEVSPDSRPPVCRIMDFGKYKYELAKKERVAKKKQHAFQLKEMRFRPKIDDHDFDFKTRHAREFLLEGSKVRLMVLFRGREIAHFEFGEAILKRAIEVLADVATPDAPPKLEGNTLSVVMTLKADLLRKLAASKAPRKDKEEKKQEAQLDN